MVSSPRYSPFDGITSALQSIDDSTEDVHFAGVNDYTFDNLQPMSSISALNGLPNVGDPNVVFQNNNRHTTLSSAGPATYGLSEGGSMIHGRSNSIGTQSASLFLAALGNSMNATDTYNGAATSLDQAMPSATINPLTNILNGTNASGSQAALTTPGSATLSLSAPFGDMSNFDGILSGSADLSSMLFGNFFSEQSPQSQQLPASEVHGWDISNIFPSLAPTSATAPAAGSLQPSFADDFYLKFIDETFGGAVPASIPGGPSGASKDAVGNTATLNAPGLAISAGPSHSQNAVGHDATDEDSAAMSGLLTLAAERVQQDRASGRAGMRSRTGHLPPLQHGLHTRQPSPVDAPEADPLWPTDWDPARPEHPPGHDSSGHISDGACRRCTIVARG